MLDVNTPRGQITLSDELRAAQLFERAFPGNVYCHTDKAKPSKLDAVIVKGSSLKYCVLTSCRYNVTLDTVRGAFNNEMLVTWRKLALGAFMSRRLCTPLVGFFYIVDSNCLLACRLYDERWLVTFRREVTETRATVNGGTALRLNAFIKMDDALVINGGAA